MGRRLGQHFLVRDSVLARIARIACPEPEPLVIEIGPGRGALTRHLIRLAERVIAIELDPALASMLREKLAGRVEILEADVLSVDLSRWGPAVIAGNLPYYITSPILERTLAHGSLLKRAVFLVQKEVAERVAASPGSRDYGYLSVFCQIHAQAELLFTVPPGAFAPPPKVDSAVVRLTPRPAPVADVRGFLAFAAQCFRQKRKTLRNNLRGVVPADVLSRMPEAGLRAEQLSLDQLVELYRRTTTPL